MKKNDYKDLNWTVKDVIRLIGDYKETKGTNEEEGLDFAPPYQRDFTSSVQIMNSIIAAVKSGTLINPVVVRRNPSRPGVFEVLDGRQRIETIYRYYNSITNDPNEKTSFNTKYIRVVDVGEMDDQDAYNFFVLCNTNSTRMNKTEVLRVHHTNALYKEVYKFKEQYKKYYGTVDRDKDLETLIRYYFWIQKNKEMPIGKTALSGKAISAGKAVSDFRELMKSLDEGRIDDKICSTVNDNLKSFFVALFKIREELTRRELTMNEMRQDILAISLSCLGKINSNQIGQFFNNNLEVLTDDQKLVNEINKDFIIKLKGTGGELQKFTFRFFIKKAEELSKVYRDFNKNIKKIKNNDGAECSQCGAKK